MLAPYHLPSSLLEVQGNRIHNATHLVLNLLSFLYIL